MIRDLLYIIDRKPNLSTILAIYQHISNGKFHNGVFLPQFVRTQLFIIEIRVIKTKSSSTYTVL